MDDRPIRSLFQRDPNKKEDHAAHEPAEVDLTPEDQEKIRQARDLINLLVKTAKAYRIYAANNELLKKFQDELFSKFQEFLGRYEDLELRIRQASITLLGQPLYRSQDQSDNLANQLFRDGLRRISFHSGLTNEELVGFLDILKRNSDRSREEDFDFITLLWEKDFKFITYHAVEDLLPEGIEPTTAEAEAEANIEKITTLNFYTDEDLSIDVDAFGFEPGEKRQDVFDNEPPSEATIMKSQMASHFLALESEEIRKIQATIQDEKIEDLFIDMADTIMEVIYVERSFEDFQMLVDSLDQILSMFLNNFDIQHATEILKRLQFLADGFRQTSSKAAEAIDKLIEKLISPERLQGLSAAIGQGTVLSLDHLANMLLHIGPSAVPFICTLVNETQNADFRKNLCDVLVLLGRKHFEKVMEHLDDRNEAAMRNKIYILTRLGNDKSVSYFRKLTQHPSPAIRQLTVNSLSRFYSPVTREVLFQILNDRDLAVRMTVLKCLGQTNDRKVLEALLPLVRGASFHEKDLPEKRQFFSTIALIGGNELAESLGQILSRNNLKDKNKDNEVRICAAEALGLIGSPEALSYLEAGVKIKQKPISQTCTEQIHMIRQRQGGA